MVALIKFVLGVVIHKALASKLQWREIGVRIRRQGADA
jgi:hypothetical protein